MNNTKQNWELIDHAIEELRVIQRRMAYANEGDDLGLLISHTSDMNAAVKYIMWLTHKIVEENSNEQNERSTR